MARFKISDSDLINCAPPKEIIRKEKVTLLSSFFTFQLPLVKRDGQSDIWIYSFERGDARRDQPGVEGCPGEQQTEK